jgi:hypothetical protein
LVDGCALTHSGHASVPLAYELQENMYQKHVLACKKKGGDMMLWMPLSSSFARLQGP